MKNWVQLPLAVFGLSLLIDSCVCFAVPFRTPNIFWRNARPKREDSNPIQEILDLLKEGDENIEFGSKTEAVLVLGNTGAGKSTFTVLIAGDNDRLTSKEVGEGTEEYIIVDEDDLISGNSTITSKTLVPNLLVANDTNIEYYDCAGFSDTRSPSFDIAATYFTKRVIDYLKKVKLALNVNYSSVRQGGDRFDFMLLIKHIVNLIKNISKYEQSIALVVTKVENTYKKEGGQMVLVPDNKVIENIVRFINGVKQELEEKLGLPTTSPEDRAFYEKAIEFINIVLIKNGDNYPRIGIFRRPDEAGKISEIELIQNCKKSLKHILEKEINFTPKDNDDFGYTISAESQNHVGDLIKEITRLILNDIANIGKETETYYLKEEKQFSDIYVLQQKYKYNYQVLSKTASGEYKDLTEFIEQLQKDLKLLGIGVSNTYIENISNYNGHLKFLEEVSGQAPEAVKWSQGLSGLVGFLSDSQKLYSFVVNLYTLLSEYHVQQDVSRYDISNLLRQLNINEAETTQISKTDMKKLIDQVNKGGYDTGYDEIKHVELDSTRARLLSKTLDLTLRHKTNVSCKSSNRVVIQGQYIKLSETDELRRKCGTANSLEIFALNRVFIDTEYNKANQQLDLSIVAPTWQILSKSNIILSGIKGSKHYPSVADNGKLPSDDGKDGKPGLPGGTSANFFGVGANFTNINILKISTDGGSGADGQHGGEGVRGESYESPSVPQKNKDENWDTNKFKVEVIGYWSNANPASQYYETTFRVTGRLGGRGGRGGDGGSPGLSGYVGRVQFINMNGPAKPAISSLSGNNGLRGVGGYGSSGGNSGNILVVVKMERYIMGFHSSTNWNVKSDTKQKGGENGRDGYNGYNTVGQEKPKGATSINPKPAVNEYKTYLKNSLSGSIIEMSLREFYDQLNSHNDLKNA